MLRGDCDVNIQNVRSFWAVLICQGQRFAVFSGFAHIIRCYTCFMYANLMYKYKLCDENVFSEYKNYIFWKCMKVWRYCYVLWWIFVSVFLIVRLDFEFAKFLCGKVFVKICIHYIVPFAMSAAHCHSVSCFFKKQFPENDYPKNTIPRKYLLLLLCRIIWLRNLKVYL